MGIFFPFYLQPIHRDCCLFALINTLTSLLAGCVIFATLGNMAKIANVPINMVAESGPGLAFVIYPKALGTMPYSPFWAVCFFLMLLLLGIDSMVGISPFYTRLSTRTVCHSLAAYFVSKSKQLSNGFENVLIVTHIVGFSEVLIFELGL